MSCIKYIIFAKQYKTKMIRQSDLTTIINVQKKHLSSGRNDIGRNLLNELPANLDNHALIISGIRRCGKSTLLGQLIKSMHEDFLFINFDTPLLYGFEMADFTMLDQIIAKKGCNRLFFDEIQVVKGWELYIRQKLDERFKVIVTGSNASLLSQELGTKLTGRHITKILYPFSFQEFNRFLQLKSDTQALLKYLDKGGFPDYVKTNNPEILTSLFEDILFRDIAVRFGVRDIQSLKRLLLYLVANVGNMVTANKLTHVLEIKSTATILEYFSYFEQTYLLSLMPKFSYSYKVQSVNPRKIFIMDNGLIGAVTPSYSKDLGRKLENAVYWKLRQLNKTAFYFNETGFECDFVVTRNNEVEELIQVCYDLNHDTSIREERGLLEAMKYFNKDVGTIITINQRDEILTNGKTIRVIPAFEFL